VTTAGVRGGPELPSPRLLALDHLRGFVVVVVVLHHAMLAYCRFARFDHRHYLASTAPVVDADRWAGFDLLVLLNDSFFMPLMFLLSGLFVWSSFARKGPVHYFRGRLLRLGVPFAIAVLTVMPLAYYPSFRLTGATSNFVAFWVDTVTIGPWPGGPAWFVGVLLLFDGAATVILGLVRRKRAIVPSWTAPGVTACVAMIVVVSAAAYLPLLMRVGASRWLSVGPLAVQASRIGLYAVYFGVGVVLGMSALRPDQQWFNAIARCWRALAVFAVLAGGVLVAVQIARLHAGPMLPAPVWLALYGMTVVVFCAATCFALTALFLYSSDRHTVLCDSVAANAYGIYLLHYPMVTWMQYGLLGTSLGAIGKAALVFSTALLLSWCATGALRRILGVARVI
jgi:peptidoglycan/LPS O-acetylase OafA/YrhL